MALEIAVGTTYDAQNWPDEATTVSVKLPLAHKRGTMTTKSSIKNLLHHMGLDVVRYRENPQNTLLGLRDRPINTILDIGANVGQMAKLYRQMFRDAHIYCFEPLPDVFQKLESWARTQHGKVTAFNVALGDETRSGTMNRHTEHSPSSSLLSITGTACRLYPQVKKQTKVGVRLARLDDLAGSLELVDETLVKMDVQGYEARVIQGGKNILMQAVGCIVETNLQPLYREQAAFAELVLALHDLGFVYAGNLSQIYDIKGYVIYADAVFLRNGYLGDIPQR